MQTPAFPRPKDKTMSKIGAFIAVVALSFGYSAAAIAKTVEYVSQHPVPHKYGGGFCTIEVPHVHNYPPDDHRMYRQLGDGKYYFVGDPTPFQYDGPRYAYYGAHPVVEAEARVGHPVFCYIKGPHYHPYEPPPQAQFQFTGGAYWYVGNFPPAYYDDRPHFAVINEAYAPLVYTRPVVDVQLAPPIVRADLAIGGPGWGARVALGVPVAPVAVVPVAAPPPPPVAVVPVPAPALEVGVGINIGGGGEIIERHEIIERRYHDRGRHEGWRERPRFEERPRRGPPARYVAGPAPVTRPLFHRRPQPAPRMAPPPRGPAPRPMQAAPMRGQAQPSHQASPSRAPATQPQNDRRHH
jgi:hypothetical protein